MNFLEKRILAEGNVKQGNVLKVDSFLNHQMDIELFYQMANEWKKRFEGVKIDKILTVESSGIGIAAIVGYLFKVPVVFAKKSQSINLDGDLLVDKAYSFTHKTENHVIVAKRFINEGENILIIDDFLAKGHALNSLIAIVRAKEANVAGIGIAIEKGFQEGGKHIREKGYRIESLAIVESMNHETGEVIFREQ